MNITPYSENVIFFDTEFSSLDPYKGEILSLGLVKMSGEELYLELEYSGEIDAWPSEHVVPYLTKKKVDKQEAYKNMHDFVGAQNPYLVAYVNQFDTIYLHKLLTLKVSNELFHWIPIDFASILFSHGIDPEVIAKQDKAFFDTLNIDLSHYHLHNALDDAKLLRDIYLKLI